MIMPKRRTNNNRVINVLERIQALDLATTELQNALEERSLTAEEQRSYRLLSPMCGFSRLPASSKPVLQSSGSHRNHGYSLDSRYTASPLSLAAETAKCSADQLGFGRGRETVGHRTDNSIAPIHRTRNWSILRRISQDVARLVT